MPWSLLPELLGLSPASLVSVKELAASAGKGAFGRAHPLYHHAGRTTLYFWGLANLQQCGSPSSEASSKVTQVTGKSTNPLFLDVGGGGRGSLVEDNDPNKERDAGQL